MSNIFDHIPKKSSKICFIILVMIYAFVNLIILIVSYTSLDSSVGAFESIISNWQTKAIIDLTVDDDCPSDFEEAIAYTWPGISEGCWCGDVSYAARRFQDIHCELCTGSCNYTQTFIGCTNIYPVAPKPLTTWGRVLGNDRKICIKRSNETWAEVAQQSGASCKSRNLKKCGSSPEFAFCTNGSKCPINDIKIITVDLKTNPSALASCLDVNYCYILSQDYFTLKVLQYRRGDTFDALPTARIRLNEYGMCNDPSKDNITPTRSEFSLLKAHRTSCSNQADHFWNVTDFMTEKQLFDLNNLTSTIDSLRRYGYYSGSENGSQYTWKLFTQSYVPWNVNCRDLMPDIINYQDELESVETYQMLVVIIGFIAFVCLGMVLPCLLLQNLCCGNACCFSGSGKEERKKMKKFARRWTFVFMVLQAPFQILAVVNASKAKSFIRDIFESNCSNSDVLSTFGDVADSLDTTSRNNIIAIVILVCIILISILFYSFKDYMKKQKKKFMKGLKKNSDSFEMSNLAQKLDESPQVGGAVVGQPYNPPVQYGYAQPSYQNQYAPPLYGQNQQYGVQYQQQYVPQYGQTVQYPGQYQQQYAPQFVQQNMNQYPAQDQKQGHYNPQ